MKNILIDIKLPTRIKYRGDYLPFYRNILIRPVDQMTLDEEIAVRKIFATDENDIYEEISQIFFRQSKKKCIEKWKLYLYTAHVLDQIEKWGKAEAQKLNYKPTSEELEAGYDDFKKFGDFLTYDAIAKRLMLTHEQVGKLNYTTVFAMMWKDLKEYQYRERLQKINERKAKK